MLPAVLLVILAVAVLGGDDGSGCSGHDGEWMTTIAGHCARLVPSR
jgi:hypothetical protein